MPWTGAAVQHQWEAATEAAGMFGMSMLWDGWCQQQGQQGQQQAQPLAAQAQAHHQENNTAEQQQQQEQDCSALVQMGQFNPASTFQHFLGGAYGWL
mmetsp:Transcript_12467/g.34039  ORF Transcript_12467/g.34039 Transcript_12467/m.34039 type:complete len:97 (-) Transcript_12467:179-469(-)